MLQAVWIDYKIASDEADIKVAAYVTFTSLVSAGTPHNCNETYVRFVPTEQCQYYEAANTPESVKLQVTTEYMIVLTE